MGKCVVCGNDYDKSFTINLGGKTQEFDSFECAIHALAPHCAHCQCAIIGHGVEKDGKVYCCANCAQYEGNREFVDRVDTIPKKRTQEV